MRGRLAIVAVLVLSLLAAGVTRDLARGRREAAREARSPAGAVPSRSSLSGMHSFALALLLGGLRGPLVMVLWTSSENQKNEKNLEDFDTKVEWIRLLQPEFDTVHIFQIWNKAYNVSVQMASLANKYATILDALEYARSVDAERPNNINIITAIAQVYFDKLGNSSEKYYYRRRMRQETQHQAQAPRQRRVHEVVLDERGNILPQKLAPIRPRPGDLPAESEWNDGSELQYLAPYQPLPYGISPYALGYAYYKRAQVLQSVGKQKHAQLSELVVDSRPALALKHWAEEEWETARRLELGAFDKPIPVERLDMELPTASLGLDQKPAAPALIDAALHSYATAARLAADATKEYERHLRNFATNADTYASHLLHIDAVRLLNQGDHDFLAALRAHGEERQALLDSARTNYQQAANALYVTILRYYVDDGIARATFPTPYTRANIQHLDPEQFPRVLAKVHRLLKDREMFDQHNEDRLEYERYLDRASTRLDTLRQATAQASP